MPGPFIVDQQRIRGPATHAMVIGVGHYPHLPGGGSRTQIASPEGLDQLTSPPISARAIATWLIAGYNNPDRPMASVALLTSERRKKPFLNPRTGVAHAIETATIENIETAVTQWRQRAEAGTDQRLIFYFCGHGIANGTAATLLASNYGEKPFNTLAGAFNFQNFRDAMALSSATEQVYFIDACRVASTNLLRVGTPAGSLVTGDRVRPPDAPEILAPTFYSTLPGTTAYARKGKVSFYTEALIQGLDGAGSVNFGRGWRVTTLGLQNALSVYLERELKRIGRTGTPPTDQQVRLDLCLPTREPTATARVTCDPAIAMWDATLTFTGRGQTERRPRPRKGDWVLELLPGLYQFQAQFPGGSWRSETEEAYIQPVEFDVTIRVTR